MQSPVRELHIQADLTNLAIVAEFVSACCEHWRIDAKNTFDIQLAVDEAVTNIIEHAYAGEPGEVSLRCWVATHHFYVQLQDTGRLFNPADVPYPNIAGSLTERRTGGLGIYFMRHLMDEVHFGSNENGNLLQMVKYDVAP